MASIHPETIETDMDSRFRLAKIAEGTLTLDEVMAMRIEAVRGYLRMHERGLWPSKILARTVRGLGNIDTNGFETAGY